MIFKIRKRTSGWTGKHLAFVPVRDGDADLQPHYTWPDGTRDIGEPSVDRDLPPRHAMGGMPLEFVVVLGVQSSLHRGRDAALEAGPFFTRLDAINWAYSRKGRIADEVLDSEDADNPEFIDQEADADYDLPIIGATVNYSNVSPDSGETIGWEDIF